MSKSSRGFTVLELLVVIVILGGLLALVWIGIKSARSKARDSLIASEMEQISKAASLIYSESNSYSYSGNELCYNDTLNEANTSHNLDNIYDSILANNNNRGVVCYSNSDSFCVETSLLNSGSFCIDFTGYKGKGTICSNIDLKCVVHGNVDDYVSVSFGSTRYDLRTKETNIFLTVTNMSSLKIKGPVWFVVTNQLPGSVSFSGTGTTSDGYPYLDLGVSEINPGGSVSGWISFYNPNRIRLEISPSIFGSF